MTPATVEPARLTGLRLLAVLATAVVASIVSGRGLGSALPLVAPSWTGDAHRLAAAIVGVVYLSVAVVLLAGFGRRAGQRRSWLALTRPDRPSLTIGVTVWVSAYAISTGVYTAASP